MALYERLLHLRSGTASSPVPPAAPSAPAGGDARAAAPADPAIQELGARLADLERLRQGRQGLLRDAGKRLDALDAALRDFAQTAPQPVQPTSDSSLDSAGWQRHPDPDAAAMNWFDFVIGRAGPEAIRPLLEHYHELGWISDGERAWFMQLASSVAAPDANWSCTDPQLMRALDERTRELLGRLRG